jgi:hypothetical protein
MKFIKLVDNSQAIENTIFKELYLSKLNYLERTLLFFDKKGIEATVIFHCEHTDNKLQTFTEVICEDEGYRNLLERILAAFNSMHSYKDIYKG